MTIGIAVAAFAKRVVEPNPVNQRIGETGIAIDCEIRSKGIETLTVFQIEPALVAKNMGHPIDHVVTIKDARIKSGNKQYLDTIDLMTFALERFREQGVTDVVIVANTFLHLQAARKMARDAGFNVLTEYKIPRVGFDPSPLNLQWWCKGPIRFMTYLGLQVVGKVTNRDFHGIGEKSATP